MSSEENKKVIDHMNQTVSRFYSIEDERLGMKHFRYVMDDYFAADESIKCCGSVKPVSADGVYALWVTTENSDPKKRILYLHGGGYVIGSVRGYLPLASHLAKATGASVLLIDYSLSPESIFPSAVNDAKLAYNWMLNNGPEGEEEKEKVIYGVRNNVKTFNPIKITFFEWLSFINDFKYAKDFREKILCFVGKPEWKPSGIKDET